jgi:ATP-dependent protease ClpP protease subunit
VLKFLTAAFAAFFVLATTVPAKTAAFVADKDRTVYVRGEIDGSALLQAAEVMRLATKSTAPITLVINSPGGNVYTGLQLMSAIGVAQQRGVTVRCFVPVLAASMAFQILSICDERYTLQYSLLLFHPARAFLNGAFLAEDLEYAGEQLRQLDDRLKSELAARLGMDRAEYDFHYRRETMWLASDLNDRADGFLTIVGDFRGVENPFDLM